MIYEVRDQIAYLSFDRPEKHNALRDEDLGSMVECMDRFDHDDDAQVAILFGQGRSFSSGADVASRLQASMCVGSTTARVNEGDAFLECDNWKPIIAAIHGYCLGHALGTALHCDLLVAARTARFQVTEIRIGLPTPSLMDRLGNAGFASDVGLTGRMFSAEEAWNAGMLSRLVDDGEHVQGAEELARQVLENPQAGVREYVRVRRALNAETSSRLGAMSAEFSAGWATRSDAAEAIAAKAAQLHGSK
jgi:enoyl-CoA hydratase/carnithine racemase